MRSFALGLVLHELEPADLVHDEPDGAARRVGFGREAVVCGVAFDHACDDVCQNRSLPARGFSSVWKRGPAAFGGKYSLASSFRQAAQGSEDTVANKAPDKGGVVLAVSSNASSPRSLRQVSVGADLCVRPIGRTEGGRSVGAAYMRPVILYSPFLGYGRDLGRGIDDGVLVRPHGSHVCVGRSRGGKESRSSNCSP